MTKGKEAYWRLAAEVHDEFVEKGKLPDPDEEAYGGESSTPEQIVALQKEIERRWSARQSE